MPENRRVRVVVGDDHPLFRDGLVRALSSSGEIDVVAEAEDGSSALALIKEHRPDVALLDYQMPGMDGGEVAAAVVRDELATRVLLVSAHDEAEIVYHALQQGAAGFLPRTPPDPRSSTPSWTAPRGATCWPPAGVGAGGRDPPPRRAVRAVPERAGTRGARHDRPRPEHPGDRRGAVPGPSTVKTHVQRLYEKLGVSDRAAAVAEAMRRGLLE